VRTLMLSSKRQWVCGDSFDLRDALIRLRTHQFRPVITVLTFKPWPEVLKTIAAAALSS
jgi:hypothetical protein